MKSEIGCTSVHMRALKGSAVHLFYVLFADLLLTANDSAKPAQMR